MKEEKYVTLISRLKAGLSTSEDNIDILYRLLNHPSMREIIVLLLDDTGKNDFKIPDNSYIEFLKLLLQSASLIYNNTGMNTGMTDSEYDSLIEFYYSITNDENIYETKNISSDNVTSHTYLSLRGTLDKIYKLTEEDILKNSSQSSLDDWISRTEKRYENFTGNKIDLRDCEVMVMPKFDGVSVVFECDRNGELIKALTRGDTLNNEAKDITHIFRNIFKGSLTDQPFPYGEKTEVMMLNDKLLEYNETYNKDYKNTRSIVSSIINSKEIDTRIDYLHIVSLRVSHLENGNESNQLLSPKVYNYPYLKCKLKEIDRIREFSFANKTVYPGLRCDGSVIQILDPEIQKVLGRENNKQKYEVAFKFTEEIGYSEVKDIEFTTGLFGRINPVVKFKPIKLKGNEIKKASLGSYSRFKDLELAKGDIIKVLYDIIPYVVFDSEDSKCVRSGNKIIKPPTHCQECGEILDVTGDILRCINTECPCIEKGKILNYCRKLKIQHISYATIEDMYQEKLLRNIKDLYSLHDHVSEIIKMDGYNNKKITVILDEIDNHREMAISELMGAIGIESVSTKTFKNIFEFVTLDEVLDISKDKNYEFFTFIPGIKEKTSRKIVDGINKNRSLIEFLLTELIVKADEKHGNDFSVVFTKIRDKDKEAWIYENGGTVSDSVSKNTSLVVVPVKGTESSKVLKANKYNIPIVTIDELIPYIKENFM